MKLNIVQALGIAVVFGMGSFCAGVAYTRSQHDCSAELGMSVVTVTTPGEGGVWGDTRLEFRPDGDPDRLQKVCEQLAK